MPLGSTRFLTETVIIFPKQKVVKKHERIFFGINYIFVHNKINHNMTPFVKDNKQHQVKCKEQQRLERMASNVIKAAQTAPLRHCEALRSS